MLIIINPSVLWALIRIYWFPNCCKSCHGIASTWMVTHWKRERLCFYFRNVVTNTFEHESWCDVIWCGLQLKINSGKNIWPGPILQKATVMELKQSDFSLTPRSILEGAAARLRFLTRCEISGTPIYLHVALALRSFSMRPPSRIPISFSSTWKTC